MVQSMVGVEKDQKGCQVPSALNREKKLTANLWVFTYVCCRFASQNMAITLEAECSLTHEGVKSEKVEVQIQVYSIICACQTLSNQCCSWWIEDQLAWIP